MKLLLMRVARVIDKIPQTLRKWAGVCKYCGWNCGMNSAVSKYGFTCNYCLEWRKALDKEFGR